MGGGAPWGRVSGGTALFRDTRSGHGGERALQEENQGVGEQYISIRAQSVQMF